MGALNLLLATGAIQSRYAPDSVPSVVLSLRSLATLVLSPKKKVFLCTLCAF